MKTGIEEAKTPARRYIETPGPPSENGAVSERALHALSTTTQPAPLNRRGGQDCPKILAPVSLSRVR